MNFRPRAREELDLNLIPLIDVVFMLLIFFMLTTTFVRETALDIQLPLAATGEVAPDRQAHTLEIGPGGEYVLNGRHLNGGQLVMAMRGIDDKQRPLLIMADGNAPHQRVITAMDAAREAGIEKLSLGTLPPR